MVILSDDKKCRHREHYMYPFNLFQGRYTNFNEIADDIYERGRTLLEEPITDSDWETFKKSKQLYKTCMNEDLREELGATPLKEKLTELLGGWTVLEGKRWDSANEDYQVMVKHYVIIA